MSHRPTNLRVPQARQSFSEAVSGDDRDINLVEASLLIASEEYPDLIVADYIEKLGGFADSVRERLKPGMNSFSTIAAINDAMFTEFGFRGNTESYYDPRNSFINQVIDRRKGIPITLSVIYLDLAKRVDFPMLPVGLPGHFLVKHSDRSGDVYVDVFNGGRILIEPEVADLLARVMGESVTLSHGHLSPVTNKQVLTRILANLYRVYTQSMDYRRALSVVDRMSLIEPDAAGYVRDRGILSAAVNDFDSAIVELERYLKLSPDAADAETIRNRIKAFRLNKARLN